jgi:hypothetical protein
MEIEKLDKNAQEKVRLMGLIGWADLTRRRAS